MGGTLIGDIVISDGETYEVVWAGGEGLVPDRDTKPSSFWTPPKRLYNKKSDYWTTPRKTEKPETDSPSDELEDNDAEERS